MKFTDVALAEPFQRALKKLKYETASPIQAEAIPVILDGKDLIGCAQTGTGKTAAFALPMLHRLLESAPPREQPTERVRGKRTSNKFQGPPRPIRALILAPTRELAAQISESLKKYGGATSLKHTVVFGGVSQVPQVRDLRWGIDTLVATPGRLLDLMTQGHINLSQLEILCFDEADQMLDMGFLPALKKIVAACPHDRQTVMFSATMPPEIRDLAEKWLTNPVSLQVAPVAAPAERISQSVHYVDKRRKADLLSRYLQDTPRSRTLVFVRTKHDCDKLVRILEKDGLRAAAIHSNKSQSVRSRTLAQFKSNRPPVLVATDIAARGLDVNDVSHVVNFDLPETPETYVHRIGRTARAGAEGVAVSFCAGGERRLLKQIERLTRISIPIEPAIDGFETSDPITHDEPRRGGSRGRGPRGNGGPRTSGGPRKFGSKPGGKKPSRFGSKSNSDNQGGDDRPSDKKPAAAGPFGNKNKPKRIAGKPATGFGQKQKRRRPANTER
ncbi:DEAD/DEAH box helicase [Bremerella alba]|uniref:ATP-dependent RNA helicase RhlE n=1 Tax=Bremerella alba TaxID=980252 RepID=A0A7V8V9C4_9BACT|nr:DEAD/DEAH box helicase [Bremerella alba]MBA2117026.1 ATP-dependent RNA helicase RhlE [Bremerella alba]